MDEYRETGACAVCGRVTHRWIHSYVLGRTGSMPYRLIDRWRHEDDNTLVCDDYGDRRQEFPDTM